MSLFNLKHGSMSTPRSRLETPGVVQVQSRSGPCTSARTHLASHGHPVTGCTGLSNHQWGKVFHRLQLLLGSGVEQVCVVSWWPSSLSLGPLLPERDKKNGGDLPNVCPCLGDQGLVFTVGTFFVAPG